MSDTHHFGLEEVFKALEAASSQDNDNQRKFGEDLLKTWETVPRFHEYLQVSSSTRLILTFLGQLSMNTNDYLGNLLRHLFASSSSLDRCHLPQEWPYEILETRRCQVSPLIHSYSKDLY